jgi:hypothetical protein
MERSFVEDQVKKLAGLIEEAQADLLKWEDKLIRITVETDQLRAELSRLRCVKRYFEDELAAETGIPF